MYLFIFVYHNVYFIFCLRKVEFISIENDTLWETFSSEKKCKARNGYNRSDSRIILDSIAYFNLYIVKLVWGQIIAALKPLLIIEFCQLSNQSGALSLVQISRDTLLWLVGPRVLHSVSNIKNLSISQIYRYCGCAQCWGNNSHIWNKSPYITILQSQSNTPTRLGNRWVLIFPGRKKKNTENINSSDYYPYPY